MGKSPKLPLYGGEGKENYRKSSDTKLPQHGGEGKSVGKKTDMKLQGSGSDGGSGRVLKVTAN